MEYADSLALFLQDLLILLWSLLQHSLYIPYISRLELAFPSTFALLSHCLLDYPAKNQTVLNLPNQVQDSLILGWMIFTSPDWNWRSPVPLPCYPIVS